MKYWSVLLLGLLPLWAQALEVGERLAPWTLLDQFDQAFTLDSRTQTLLVARSMDGAKLVECRAAGPAQRLSGGPPCSVCRGYPAHATADRKNVRGAGHARLFLPGHAGS